MAFSRPTLSEIVQRATTDLSTRIIGSVAALRRSVIKAFGSVIGGAVHSLYGYLDYIAREAFVDTAKDASTLERYGSIWGVPRNSPTFADGFVVFTGTNGTVLPALTSLQRSDGVLYSTLADGTIASGTVTVEAVCLTSGDTGNMLSGENLTIVTPIAGITSQGTVDTDGMTGGADVEEVEAWRERILEKIRKAPRGGNASDYEFWAKEITGVTRVWVYENQYGAGTVGLAFVRDNDTPTIFPSAGEIADVQDYIDTVRPLTADLTVWAPVAQVLNFTISITPDTAAIRAAVQAELEDLIKRVAEPGGTILLSQIREAVSAAAGEEDNAVTVPAADATATAGNLFTMGTITWV